MELWGKGIGLWEEGVGKCIGQEHGKWAWGRDIGKGMSCGKDMG